MAFVPEPVAVRDDMDMEERGAPVRVLLLWITTGCHAMTCGVGQWAKATGGYVAA